MAPAGYGRQPGGTKHRIGLEIIADGAPEWLGLGVSIDWDTVVAVSGAPVTLLDGMIIPIGYKYLRYGTALARITRGEVNTLTESGPVTAGTFDLTVSIDGGTPVPLADVAHDVTAAAFQTALEALSNIGAGNITVGRAGSAGTYVYTLTGIGALLGKNITLTVDSTGLTGGVVTLGTTQEGSKYGMFGPADSAAADGRQTWTNGAFGLLNRTLVMNNPYGDLPMPNVVHKGLITGGLLWAARINVAQSGHPTLVQIRDVLRRVDWQY